MHSIGILVKEDIVAAHKRTGRLIQPFDESHLQPSSYDISVSQVLERGVLRDFDEVSIEHLQFVNLVAGETLEFPLDLVGHIYLRSTYARAGLGVIHLGRIEAGWKGRLVIEVLNASDLPVVIKKEERVATVEFVRLAKPVGTPYDGKFQGFGT